MNEFNVNLILVKAGESIEVTTCIQQALRLTTLFKGETMQVAVGYINHDSSKLETSTYHETDYDAFLNFTHEGDKLTATVSGNIELKGKFTLF